MRIVGGVAGLALAGLAAGCGGSSGSTGGTVNAGGVSASVTASNVLTGPCRSIEQTIRSIPGDLRQAVTAKNPVHQIARTVSALDQRLMNEAASASSDVRSAVDDYATKLKRAASKVRGGHAPDLSALNSSQIDDVCNAESAVTVSTTSTGSG